MELTVNTDGFRDARNGWIFTLPAQWGGRKKTVWIAFAKVKVQGNWVNCHPFGIYQPMILRLARGYKSSAAFNIEYSK
jgi:hypothetical protein